MVSSVAEENVKKLREARYLAVDIVHRLPDAGQIIPTPRPHERWCSSPISFADWASVSSHLSEGSCSTMAWISTI